MLEQLKKKWALLAAANEQKVSMRGRLNIYLVSLLLVIFAAFMLILSVSGVFSHSQKKLSDTLEMQHSNTAHSISEHLDSLTAQGISMSSLLSDELTGYLAQEHIDFEQLNDSPKRIADLEERMYPVLYTALQVSECSGVYMLLDVTANTALDYADTSRAGLYLRYSDLSGVNAANKHMVLFRGSPEIARSKKLEMHNRWNLEMDISDMDDIRREMTLSDGRLADRCVWTGRMPLKDTWESVALLCVPIMDETGTVRGVCGVEISDMYFRLSNTSSRSSYGSTLTVLSVDEGDSVDLSRSMLGYSEDVYLANTGIMTAEKGKYCYSYCIDSESYLGLHSPLPFRTVGGGSFSVVSLIPESHFRQAANLSRIGWTCGFLVFLLASLAASLYISKKFVSPIVQSLDSIGSDAAPAAPSGIQEIDQMLEYVRTQMQRGDGTLPPNIEALFSSFNAKVDTLTATERTILQYYIDGYDINAVAENAFISINTVKKHNTNINRKLDISTREELMLYIDLYRRCGRIDEISC